VTHPEHGDRDQGELPWRVVAIGAASALMVVVVVLIAPGLAPAHGVPDDAAVAPLEAPATPIAAEAGVFALRPGELAARPDADPRRGAHPRTAAMYRGLRAYPGGPPRVPHGLTLEEYRDGRCNVCHRRGGFVTRFNAYAPVNPHPELGGCLQCHLPDDALVGRPYPDDVTGESICFQCHTLDRKAPIYVPVEWPEPTWPELPEPALPGGPPPIPHALHMRENCLACHGGIGVMEEIRIGHPERSNCRGCHVEVGDGAAVFSRAGIESEATTGGDR